MESHRGQSKSQVAPYSLHSALHLTRVLEALCITKKGIRCHLGHKHASCFSKYAWNEAWNVLVLWTVLLKQFDKEAHTSQELYFLPRRPASWSHLFTIDIETGFAGTI